MLKLHKYQQEVVDLVLDKKRFAVFLGMGMGKTLIALSVAKTLLQQGKIKKTLIIGPLSTVSNTWHTEIEKWAEFEHLTYSICTGNEKQRLVALNADVDCYIINRENVKWMLDNGFSKYGFIVVDESSSFKNASSIRFKALKKFTSRYMILLSGTPSPRSYFDIWSQIYLLDGGKRLGKNFHQFRNRYFKADYMGFNWKCTDSGVIIDKIKDISIFYDSDDQLTLPDKMSLNTHVGIPMLKYHKYRDEMYLNVRGEELTAFNRGVLTNKLLQYCNGAVYNEDGKTVHIHDVKLHALSDIIDNNANENIIVAYNFKSDLCRLTKRFKDAVVMDNSNEMIKRWNNGHIKLLLAHPASSSMGLNLQQGGNVIVWFGLTWNLEHYLQFNARLHRQGQTKPVIVNHIVAKNCMDDKLLYNLNIKDITQQKLLDNLKR